MEFDINYVAELARLKLTAEEKRRFGPQLRSILTYVKKISELKTDSVLPTFQTTGLKDVAREDKVDPKQTLSQKETLANAPGKQGDFFKVKRVFEL